MNLHLIDDGTLDTVFECGDCGETLRFSEFERDECGPTADAVAWAEEDHAGECPGPSDPDPALESLRGPDGRLPGIAWPGGYSMVYYFADGQPCCADCANGDGDSDATTNRNSPEGEDWILVGHGVHWEGPAETCAHCGKELPSEYGDPDA